MVSEAEMSTVCSVCQKSIVDSQWFCRLPLKNGAPLSQTRRILLCSPTCANRYFAFSEIGAEQI